MTLLYADTVDGFRHFATLPNVHAVEAAAAIANGSLFWVGDNGGPGGDSEMSDKPGEGLKGDGDLEWELRAVDAEAAFMPDYIATDIWPMAEGRDKAGESSRDKPAEDGWFAATQIDGAFGGDVYGETLV